MVPSTLPELVAAIAKRMLPEVVTGTANTDPAVTTKSSPAPPLTVIVLVPEVGLTKLIVALLVTMNCAQVILLLARMVAGPVAGLVPPKLVPSKIRMSVAPVEEGRVLPNPSIEVFQLEPVVIPVAAAVPPTQ